MSNLSIKPNIYSLAFGQMDLCCLNYRTIFRPRSPAQASSLPVAAETRPSSRVNPALTWHLFLCCSLMSPHRCHKTRAGGTPSTPTVRLWDSSVMAMGQTQAKGGNQPLWQPGHGSNSHILPQKHHRILHT